MEIRQALIAAEKLGYIGLSKPNECDLDVASEWRQFFSDIPGFCLNNSWQEFGFEESSKALDFLMPRRVDLSYTVNWGWFCKVAEDGQPSSVWYLSDCYCIYGFSSLELWVKAILDNHQAWMDFWKQHGAPDQELNEDAWEQVLGKFDPQQLEIAILTGVPKKNHHPSR